MHGIPRYFLDIPERLTYNKTMAKKLPAEFRKYLAKIGKKGGLKGGHARAEKMTAEERSASARKAVQARWAREQAKDSGSGV
jgi:hypothetical protein